MSFCLQIVNYQVCENGWTREKFPRQILHIPALITYLLNHFKRLVMAAEGSMQSTMFFGGEGWAGLSSSNKASK